MYVDFHQAAHRQVPEASPCCCRNVLMRGAGHRGLLSRPRPPRAPRALLPGRRGEAGVGASSISTTETLRAQPPKPCAPGEGPSSLQLRLVWVCVCVCMRTRVCVCVCVCARACVPTILRSTWYLFSVFIEVACFFSLCSQIILELSVAGRYE